MKFFTTILFISSMLSTQILASGCSEMAAFNTELNNFLKTANINNETKDKINYLSKECNYMHDMGMEVKNIDSCNEVMNMVKVY